MSGPTWPSTRCAATPPPLGR
ncbi:unnamed protein product [Spirodela intermedia]|uniref:Uncharacterized protein n=1 Tax=Spirodela intermedia TaxID=51605 RepID=A0A7I8LG94_SPIIN|nr:unnamed protein product [Spirodela intermedia]